MSKETTSAIEIFSPEVKNSIRLWSEISQESNVPIYVKGGVIRDSLINLHHGKNLKVKDLDIVVPSGILQVLQVVQKHGVKIEARGKSKKLPKYLLTFPGLTLTFDLSLLMAESISYDKFRTEEEILLQNALLSNFDINTFILGLSDGQLHDPLNAIEALKAKTINLVSEKSLQLDPSSIIQGIKIMFKTGFTISPKTKDAIRRNSTAVLKLQDWFLKQKLEEVLEYSSKDKLIVALADLGIQKVKPNIMEFLNEL